MRGRSFNALWTGLGRLTGSIPTLHPRLHVDEWNCFPALFEPLETEAILRNIGPLDIHHRVE